MTAINPHGVFDPERKLRERAEWERDVAQRSLAQNYGAELVAYAEESRKALKAAADAMDDIATDYDLLAPEDLRHQLRESAGEARLVLAKCLEIDPCQRCGGKGHIGNEVRCPDCAAVKEGEPMKPFHEWKAETKAAEGAAGRVHSKEWYWTAYGRYCNKERAKGQAEVHEIGQVNPNFDPCDWPMDTPRPQVCSHYEPGLRVIPLPGLVGNCELRIELGYLTQFWREGELVRSLDVFEDEFVRAAYAAGANSHAINSQASDEGHQP